MMRFLSLMMIALGLSLSAPSFAEGNDASSFVTELGNQVIATISNKSLSKVQREAKVEKLFTDNVDVPWIGRFVIGRFWKTATDDQKKRYLKEYQAFLMKNYASRFTDYTGGNFKITDTRNDGDDEFTVSMQIQSDKPNSEPVLLDYRVRKIDNKFKIFDVSVEGVSLLSTQRAEFTSVLNSKGLDYLTDQLANRSMSMPTDKK